MTEQTDPARAALAERIEAVLDRDEHFILTVTPEDCRFAALEVIADVRAALRAAEQALREGA